MKDVRDFFKCFLFKPLWTRWNVKKNINDVSIKCFHFNVKINVVASL